MSLYIHIDYHTYTYIYNIIYTLLVHLIHQIHVIAMIDSTHFLHGAHEHAITCFF